MGWGPVDCDPCDSQRITDANLRRPGTITSVSIAKLNLGEFQLERGFIPHFVHTTVNLLVLSVFLSMIISSSLLYQKPLRVYISILIHIGCFQKSFHSGFSLLAYSSKHWPLSELVCTGLWSQLVPISTNETLLCRSCSCCVGLQCVILSYLSPPAIHSFY